MTNARAIMVVILSVLVISMTGCFSSDPRDIKAFMMPQKVDVTAKNYILQPADQIQVFCSKVPEIHEQTQQIRPDGKISFEAVGEIDAAGKTPTQVAEALRTKILELYKLTGDHPIDVRIVVFQSKAFYVLGQVTTPGPQPYTGRDTVLRALAVAGPTVLAWQDRIQIIRPSSDKNTRPKIFEVNFDRMSAHGDTSKNVLLEEGDIIFVPPTILAAMAMKIEEIVRPIGRAFAGIYITQGPAAGGFAGGFAGGP